MCERRVSGNQLAASPEVNAQATFAGVMPVRTCWLAVTYSGSSKLTKSKWRTCAYAANVARNRNTDIQMVCRAGDLPLREMENIVPKARFQVALQFRQIKIRSGPLG